MDQDEAQDEAKPWVAILDDDAIPESVRQAAWGRPSSRSEASAEDLALGADVGMPRLHALLVADGMAGVLPRGETADVMQWEGIPDDPTGWSPKKAYPFLLRAIVRREAGPVRMVIAGKWEVADVPACRAVWLARPVLLLPGMVTRIDPASALLFGWPLTPRGAIAHVCAMEARERSDAESLLRHWNESLEVLALASREEAGH